MRAWRAAPFPRRRWAWPTCATSTVLCPALPLLWRAAPQRSSWRASSKRLGLEPRVIDAHEVRRKAHRPEQKSDTCDAQELCEGLRHRFYRSVVNVPSAEIEELCTMLPRRRHFIRIQTAEVNAVKRLLRGAGCGAGRRGTLRIDAYW